MKKIKTLTIILIIFIISTLLLACNSHEAAQQQELAPPSEVQSASPSQPAMATQSAAQESTAAGPSPSESRAVLPDDDPNVTGDESVLITDADGIITKVPVNTSLADGEYAGIISSSVNVDQGKAVAFDEILVTDGDIANDTPSVIFLLLDDTISYSLPDGTKKSDVNSNNIADLVKALTSDYYYMITVSGHKVTSIEYGGKV